MTIQQTDVDRWAKNKHPKRQISKMRCCGWRCESETVPTTLNISAGVKKRVILALIRQLRRCAIVFTAHEETLWSYSWNNCFNGTRLTVNLTIYRCRAMYVAARRLICGDLMTKQLYASSNVNVRRWITWLLGYKARKSCLCGVSITKKALLFGGWWSINVDRIIKHTIWQTSLENIYRILPLSPDPDINSAGKMARCEIASI